MTLFTFPGTFDTSSYPELQLDAQLATMVYKRFMYQMGSIGRTGAKGVKTHFEYQDKTYYVLVENPEKM